MLIIEMLRDAFLIVMMSNFMQSVVMMSASYGERHFVECRLC